MASTQPSSLHTHTHTHTHKNPTYTPKTKIYGYEMRKGDKEKVSRVRNQTFGF